MALYKCGGTKTLTETTLWTNSSPTTNFSAQTVTLNQSIENFDYIAIYTRISTSDARENATIFKVTDLKKFSESDNNLQGHVGARVTTNRTRCIAYVSNTQIKIANDTSTAASIAVPTKISGLKL